MREFKRVQLGLKNKKGIEKNIQPIDSNMESYYTYPRSYYSSMQLRSKDIFSGIHEIPHQESGEGFYKLITPSFNESIIGKGISPHAEDFNYNPKSIRERYQIMELSRYGPPSISKPNTLGESGAPIDKK